tara:strand:- start:580 stop:927 length:348 start_codon:yes stop_codon:yes gene_type:complete
MSDNSIFPMTRAEVDAQVSLCEQTMLRCKSIMDLDARNNKLSLSRYQRARLCETYSVCSLLLDSINKIFHLEKEQSSDEVFDVPKVYADALFTVLKGCVSSIRRISNANISMELH